MKFKNIFLSLALIAGFTHNVFAEKVSFEKQSILNKKNIKKGIRILLDCCQIFCALYVVKKGIDLTNIKLAVIGKLTAVYAISNFFDEIEPALFWLYNKCKKYKFAS